MPSMFNFGGSMLSALLAWTGILVAVFQSTWSLFFHSRISTKTCLLLFAIGLCITYLNYNYLTSLSESVGATQQWSGLSRVPDSLVEETEDGKAIKINKDSYSNYHYPSVGDINSYVARLQLRLFLLCISLFCAFGVIAYRKYNTEEIKSTWELILGLPTIILGLGGFGCILAMAIG